MRARVIATLVLASLASPVRADDVDVAARLKVIKEQHRPAVLITPNKKVQRVHLSLTRDDGKQISVTKKKPPRGVQSALEWEQELGTHKYSGALIISFANGTEAEMPLQFQVEVTSGAFAIEMGSADLKLDERSMTVSVGCAVDKVEARLEGEGGVLAELSQDFHGAPAGSPLTLRWEQPVAQVMRIVVKPTCTDGVFREQHFFPWSYPIEHEEVHFASGSADIPPAEQPKLDASFKAVAEALKKYSKWGAPSLYIAGHTDTVADKAYNRDLSRRRARAIARFFKQRGLKVDVYFNGFGEEAPLVPTPDNTDEPRNRRAEYIISVTHPRVEIQGFDGSWEKL